MAKYLDREAALRRLQTLHNDLVDRMMTDHPDYRLNEVAGIQRSTIALSGLIDELEKIPTIEAPVPEGVLAVAVKILADPHRHEHLVKFTEDGWTMQHPVMERVDGTLFDCTFGFELAGQIDAAWENDSAFEEGVYTVGRVQVDGGTILELNEVETP